MGPGTAPSGYQGLTVFVEDEQVHSSKPLQCSEDHEKDKFLKWLLEVLVPLTSLRRLCSGLQGAFSGLILGLLLGLVRLVLDFIYVQPRCDQPDDRPAVVKDVHYLYFSMILSSTTLITVFTVSWFTEAPSTEMVHFG